MILTLLTGVHDGLTSCVIIHFWDTAILKFGDLATRFTLVWFFFHWGRISNFNGDLLLIGIGDLLVTRAITN